MPALPVHRESWTAADYDSQEVLILLGVMDAPGRVNAARLAAPEPVPAGDGWPRRTLVDEV
ncbi:hypothetical protein ABT160_24365 [Streptomyces sp. NPDC001941]|uniref:hypothetical protein n=1 Tax=Streptomyces sp. NPDC001941 TaxID=3154659 RepID=UPI00332412D0